MRTLLIFGFLLIFLFSLSSVPAEAAETTLVANPGSNVARLPEFTEATWTQGGSDSIPTDTCYSGINASDATNCLNNGGSTSLDAAFIVNFTLPENGGINWVWANVEMAGSATGDACVMGAYNFTNSAWQNLTATGACTTTEVNHTYNITSASDISKFVSGNNFRLVARTWGAGGNVDLNVDYMRIIVGYNPEAIPPQYSSNVSSKASGTTYAQGNNYGFQINWADNVGVDDVFFETNFSTSPTLTNYSVPLFSGTTQDGVYVINFTDLAAGTYTYDWYVNDTSNNWNGTFPTLTYTIAKASSALSIAGTGTQTYPYQSTVTGSDTNSVDADCSYNLYRNAILVSNPEINIFGTGSYIYVFNNTACTNFTAGSATQTLTINQNTTNPMNLRINNGTDYYNQNVTITYGTQTTAQSYMIYTQSGTALLFRNDLAVSNPQTIILGGGTYKYAANTSGNANYSANNTGSMYYLTVVPANNIMNLWFTNATGSYLNQNMTILGGQTFNATGICSNAINCNLYKNDVLANSENKTNITPSTGSYKYTLNDTGNANYSSNSTEFYLIALSPDSDPPLYFSNASSKPSGTQYNTGNNYGFQIRWTDVTGADKVLFETDLNTSGIPTNYSVQLYSGTAQDGIYVINFTSIGVGSYQYRWYANDTYGYVNSSFPTLGYAIAKNASISGTISCNPSSTVNYPTETSCSYSETNSGDSDVVYKFYRDDVEKTSPETNTLGVDVYQYKLNTTAGTFQNYTSSSSITKLTLTVNQNSTNPINLWFRNSTNQYLNQNMTITYENNSNSTAMMVYQQAGTLNLYYDDILRSSYNNTNLVLGAGLYKVTANTSGNTNYTGNSTTYYIRINQKNANVQVSPATQTITYETSVNQYCTDVVLLNCNIYRNGTQISNDTNIVLGNATYVYEANITDTANYTNWQATSTLKINKKNLNIYTAFNGTANADRTYTYPQVVNATGWKDATLNSEGTLTFYRNGSVISGSDVQVFGNATYNYTLDFTASNYTANRTTYYVRVNKGPIKLIISPQTQTITYGTSVTQYCSDNITAIDCNIYRNSSAITNNTAIILAAGVYNYTANITDTQNFTIYQNSSLLTVSKATPSLSISGTGTQTYPYYSTVEGTETNSVDTDCSYNLYRNDTSVSNPESNTFGVGAYKYTYNTTGCANFTSGTTTQNLIISQNGTNPIKLFFRNETGEYMNQNMTILYGNNSNSTAIIVYQQSGTLNLYYNDLLKNNYNYTNMLLAGGLYKVTANTSGNTNYTQNSTTYYIRINKETLSGSISSPTVTYPSPLAASASESNYGDADVAYQTVCENMISSGLSGTFPLGAGTYDCKLNTSGAAFENYSSSASIASSSGTINQNTSNPLNMSLSDGLTTYWNQNITAGQGTQTTIQGYNIFSGSGAALLWKDDTSVSNPDVQTLGIGYYEYKTNTSGSENYSANNTGIIFSVNITEPPNPPGWSANATSLSSPQSYNPATVFGFEVRWDDNADTNGYNFSYFEHNFTGTRTNYTTSRSGNISYYNFTGIPGGTHYFRFYANDSKNNWNITNEWAYTINPASSSVIVAPLSTVMFPIPVGTGCQRVTGESASTLTLYRNGTQVATGTASPQNQTLQPLGAGVWNFTCTISASQNYSAGTSANNYLTVSQNNTNPIKLFFRNATGEYLNSNITATYPSDTNATAVLVYQQSGDLNLYRNDILKNTENGENIILGAGLQKITANTSGNTNYTGNTTTYYINISKGTRTVTLTLDGQASDITRTYNGTSTLYIVGASESNAGDADATYALFENSASTGQTGSSINYLVNRKNSTFIFTYNSSAIANWSAVTLSRTLQILKGTQNLSITSAQVVTYPTATTVSGTEKNTGDADVSYLLYRNDNVSVGSASETNTLGAGTHNYRFNATTGENWTLNSTGVATTVTVNKGDGSSYLNVYIDDILSDKTVTYPSIPKVTGNRTTMSGSSDLTYKLFKNGALYGTGTSITENQRLANATYNYYFGFDTGTNWTASNSSVRILKVLKGYVQPSLSVSPFSGTYPVQTSASCSVASQNSEAICTLSINETVVSSPDTNIFAAGFYLYRSNSSTTENYTANATGQTSILTISKNSSNPMNLRINNGTDYYNQNVSINYGTQTTAESIMINSNSGTASLFRNDIVISNPDTQTLGSGTYKYTANTSGNENYSANNTGSVYYLAVKGADNILSLWFTNSTHSFLNSNMTTNEGSSFNVTGVCGNPVSCNLYKNGALANSENNTIQTPEAGLYKYTLNDTGSANINPNSTEWYVRIVAPETPPRFSNNATSKPNGTQYASGNDYGFQINLKDNTGITKAYFQTDLNTSGTLMNYSVPLYSGGADDGIYVINFTQAGIKVGLKNYTWFFNDTVNQWNKTGLVSYTIIKGAHGTSLWLNGTRGSSTYLKYDSANFTVQSNISGKTIYLDANISGWVLQSGSTSLQNFTNLTASGVYNITGYFPGDENYSVSSETWYATVKGKFILADLIEPAGTKLVKEGGSFTMNASLTCKVENCGQINATPRYNSLLIPESSGIIYIGAGEQLKNCTLNKDESCNVAWTVFTTTIGTFNIDVNASGAAISNDTADAMLSVYRVVTEIVSVGGATGTTILGGTSKKGPLLDLEIINFTPRVMTGEKIRFAINLTNVGDQEIFDAVIHKRIKKDNFTIIENIDTRSVVSGLIINDDMDVPVNIEPGRYFFEVFVEYEGKTASALVTLEVEKSCLIMQDVSYSLVTKSNVFYSESLQNITLRFDNICGKDLRDAVLYLDGNKIDIGIIKNNYSKIVEFDKYGLHRISIEYDGGRYVSEFSLARKTPEPLDNVIIAIIIICAGALIIYIFAKMKRLINKKDIVQSIIVGINAGIRVLDNIRKMTKSQEIPSPDEYPKEKHRVRHKKHHAKKTHHAKKHHAKKHVKHHAKKTHHAKKHHAKKHVKHYAKKHHANWRKKSKR